MTASVVMLAKSEFSVHVMLSNKSEYVVMFAITVNVVKLAKS